ALVSATDIAAPIGNGALGVVHVGMDERTINDHVAALRRSLVGWSAVVTVLFSILGGIVVYVTVAKPVRLLTRVTTRIVAEGDLPQAIEFKSGDELGQLAAAFRDLVERLRSIPRQLSGLVDGVADVSQSVVRASATVSSGVGGVRTRVDETTDAIQRMLASL